MTIKPLTLGPGEVRRGRYTPSEASAVLPDWAVLVLDRVAKAAESGEEVTVSSEPVMYTPDQLARRLSMSRSTVSRKIAAGEIRSVKVGNRHRIPYSEYERVWEQMMDAMTDLAIEDIQADFFDD